MRTLVFVSRLRNHLRNCADTAWSGLQRVGTDVGQIAGRLQIKQLRFISARSVLDRLRGWPSFIRASLMGLFGIIIMVIVSTYLCRAVTDESIIVGPISVPRAFADDGLTTTVAANMLRDAIDKLAKQAKTDVPRREVVLIDELPNFTVPKTGLSLQILAIPLRHAFHIPDRPTISGDVFRNGSKILLTLRMNRHNFYSGPFDYGKTGNNSRSAGNIFIQAACATLRKTEPYVFGVLVLGYDKHFALKVADSMIESPSPSINDMKHSHNLKGGAYYDLQQFDKAKDEFLAAISLDPRYPNAYNNVGNSYFNLRKYKEAIVQFQQAIKLDAKLAGPHNGLAAAFAESGHLSKAAAEFRTAIRLSPKSALPHANLGEFYRKLHRNQKADAEFGLAKDLGYRPPTPSGDDPIKLNPCPDTNSL